LEASKNSTAESVIVDGHAHLGPREIGDEYAAMGAVYSAEQLVQSLNSNGIKMATVFAMRRLDDYTDANEYIFSSAKKYPDRIIPFARYNPWLANSAKAFEDAIESSVVKGLKLHPGDDLFDPDDNIVHPFFELAERAKIPVVLHTGGSAKPSMVGLAADRFPRVNFVLLHLGDFHDHVFVAKKCENVFIETSQCLYLHRIARRIVEKVGAQKIIWGTDVPYHYQEIEKRKLELAGLKEDELRLIMGANILRLVGGK
jgi:predicted TIM-barrel fold metal-dependent hydrolase